MKTLQRRASFLGISSQGKNEDHDGKDTITLHNTGSELKNGSEIGDVSTLQALKHATFITVVRLRLRLIARFPRLPRRATEMRCEWSLERSRGTSFPSHRECREGAARDVFGRKREVLSGQGDNSSCMTVSPSNGTLAPNETAKLLLTPRLEQRAAVKARQTQDKEISLQKERFGRALTLC